MLNYFYKIASICVFLSLMTDDVLAKTRYKLGVDESYSEWDTNERGSPPISVFIDIKTNQNFSTERGIAFDLIVKNDSSREYLIRNPADSFGYGLFGPGEGNPQVAIRDISIVYLILPVTNLLPIISGVTIKSLHFNNRKLSRRDIVPKYFSLPARGEYRYSLVIDRLRPGAAFQTGKYDLLFLPSISFKNEEFPKIDYDREVYIRLTR